MTDQERIAALEEQVAILNSERPALGGLVILLTGVIQVLEQERRHYGDRPSLVEMLDSSEVVRSMNEAPGSMPADLERARVFAMSVLEGLQARLQRP